MTALMALAVLVIGAVLVAGVCLKEQALTTDFTRKNIAPCIQYPFGTDWMGRDMFVRTLTGLSLSIRIGLITSAFIPHFQGFAILFCASSHSGVYDLI